MEYFEVTPCDITDISGDLVRFLMHIIVMHTLSSIIDNSEQLFGIHVLKTLLYSAISILLYHIAIKKIISTKKMKNKCASYNFKKYKKEYIHKRKKIH
jgi:hypothetical protein